MLGYTGHVRRQAGLGAGDAGWAARGATIVFEELDPARRARGSCASAPAAASSRDHDARRPDRRAHGGPGRLDGDAPRRQRAALPDGRRGSSSTSAVHAAKAHRRSRCTSARSSRATSSTTRTRASTSAGRARRARRRDGGGGALHGRRAPRRARPGCLLTVQRHRRRGRVHADHRRRAARRRRPDDAASRSTWRFAELSITRVVFLVNPASRQRRDREALAELAAPRAPELGLRGRDACSSARPGHLDRARPERLAGATLLVVGRRRRDAERGRERRRRERTPSSPCSRAAPGQDFGRTHGIPTELRRRRAGRARAAATRTIDLGRVVRCERRRRSAAFANVGSAGMSGAVARRANGMSKALGGRATFFYALTREFLAWQNTRGDRARSTAASAAGRCTT